MEQPDIKIERLDEYSAKDAVDLGILRKEMNPDRPEDPVSETKFRRFMEDDAGWFVARLEPNGPVVACANILAMKDPGKAWLGFVSTRTSFRGRGISKALMREIFRWCRQKNIQKIRFTSNPHKPGREASRGFYLKYGANIIEQNYGEHKVDLFEWDTATAGQLLGV